MKLITIKGRHSVLREAILPRTFVRVQPSQRHTRAKVRVRSKVSRTRTFVRGQRRTKVRPSGRPFIRQLQ